jgi:hypothetical protein
MLNKIAAIALGMGLAFGTMACGASAEDACENSNEVCDTDFDCAKLAEEADKYECETEADYGCMADAEKCEDIGKCDQAEDCTEK